MSTAAPQPATEAQRTDPPGARDFRQEVTDGIVRLLEQGVAPWQKPWEPGSSSSLGMPVNPVTGNRYRGGNAVHLLASGMQRGYDDPRWMTYKQAFEEGWQVRRGEKGTQIEFWDVKPAADRTQTVHPGGRQESGDDSDPKRPRLIHRVYTVFNAQQVENIPPITQKQPSSFEAVQTGEQI